MDQLLPTALKVTTPITLVAFFLAIVAVVLIRRNSLPKDLLKIARNANDEGMIKLVDVALKAVAPAQDLDKIAEHERLRLLLENLKHRERTMIFVLSGSLLALCIIGTLAITMTGSEAKCLSPERLNDTIQRIGLLDEALDRSDVDSARRSSSSLINELNLSLKGCGR